MPMALIPRTRQRDGLKVSQSGFSSSSSRFEKFLLRQVEQQSPSAMLWQSRASIRFFLATKDAAA
ncbi:GD13255 [Drosophila simulans]|uniref:GD13255 n=1 Tax=Drosophila simulans TaxID=7240 RepID=B4QQZ4_DROSI|nr:GD13255 [Drosophila simulans]